MTRAETHMNEKTKKLPSSRRGKAWAQDEAPSGFKADFPVRGNSRIANAASDMAKASNAEVFHGKKARAIPKEHCAAHARTLLVLRLFMTPNMARRGGLYIGFSVESGLIRRNHTKG